MKAYSIKTCKVTPARRYKCLSIHVPETNLTAYYYIYDIIIISPSHFWHNCFKMLRFVRNTVPVTKEKNLMEMIL